MSLPTAPTIQAVGNLPVTVLLSLLMGLLIYAYWDDQKEDRAEAIADRKARVLLDARLGDLFEEIATQSRLQSDLYKLKLIQLEREVEQLEELNRILREYIQSIEQK